MPLHSIISVLLYIRIVKSNKLRRLNIDVNSNIDKYFECLKKDWVELANQTF